MINEQLLKLFIDDVHYFIVQLLLYKEPYEYYWLNESHPECVVYDMSDYEIAYKYPQSGERLILNCWAKAIEHNTSLNDDDWEPFIIFVHNYVINCLEKLDNG